jgi:hypothetical protein
MYYAGIVEAGCQVRREDAVSALHFAIPSGAKIFAVLSLFS